MASDGSTGAKRVSERAESNPTGQAPVPQQASPDRTALVTDSALSEDVALSLLKKPDLPSQVLLHMAGNGSVLRQRRVMRALVEHPHTPRQVSLPLVRRLYTFDLMRVALTPTVPAAVRLAADQALSDRMERLAVGERLSLAHRGSGRIAAALLSDPEVKVVHAALANRRLTESSIVRALARHDASAAFLEAVGQHPHWSLRRDVRVALLRNGKITMAQALVFARTLPPGQVREILQGSGLPAGLKADLLADLGKPPSADAAGRGHP
jgi:hypothetical protein